MLTDAQLQQIMPRLDAAKLQLYLPHLNIALQTHGVDTSFKGRGPIQITGRFN